MSGRIGGDRDRPRPTQTVPPAAERATPQPASAAQAHAAAEQIELAAQDAGIRDDSMLGPFVAAMANGVREIGEQNAAHAASLEASTNRIASVTAGIANEQLAGLREAIVAEAHAALAMLGRAAIWRLAPAAVAAGAACLLIGLGVGWALHQPPEFGAEVCSRGSVNKDAQGRRYCSVSVWVDPGPNVAGKGS